MNRILLSLVFLATIPTLKADTDCPCMPATFYPGDPAYNQALETAAKQIFVAIFKELGIDAEKINEFAWTCSPEQAKNAWAHVFEAAQLEISELRNIALYFSDLIYCLQHAPEIRKEKEVFDAECTGDLAHDLSLLEKSRFAQLVKSRTWMDTAYLHAPALENALKKAAQEITRSEKKAQELVTQMVTFFNSLDYSDLTAAIKMIDTAIDAAQDLLKKNYLRIFVEIMARRYQVAFV